MIKAKKSLIHLVGNSKILSTHLELVNKTHKRSKTITQQAFPISFLIMHNNTTRKALHSKVKGLNQRIVQNQMQEFIKMMKWLRINTPPEMMTVLAVLMTIKIKSCKRYL